MEVERVNIDAVDIKRKKKKKGITPGFDLITQLACYTSSEDTGLIGTAKANFPAFEPGFVCVKTNASSILEVRDSKNIHFCYGITHTRAHTRARTCTHARTHARSHTCMHARTHTYSCANRERERAVRTSESFERLVDVYDIHLCSPGPVPLRS